MSVMELGNCRELFSLLWEDVLQVAVLGNGMYLTFSNEHVAVRGSFTVVTDIAFDRYMTKHFCSDQCVKISKYTCITLEVKIEGITFLSSCLVSFLTFCSSVSLRVFTGIHVC